MLKSLARWFALPNPQNGAIEAAIAHFTAATGQQASGYMCRVLVVEPERTVVRLCYGSTRPPKRVWFSVPEKREQPIQELTWEEAQELGERPWR